MSAQQVIINEWIVQFTRSMARLQMESFLPADENESSPISLGEASTARKEQAKLLYVKKKPKEILHNLSGGRHAGGDERGGNGRAKLEGSKAREIEISNVVIDAIDGSYLASIYKWSLYDNTD